MAAHPAVQVHTIAPTEGGAQLLLLGHRRLLRTATVSAEHLSTASRPHCAPVGEPTPAAVVMSTEVVLCV